MTGVRHCGANGLIYAALHSRADVPNAMTASELGLTGGVDRVALKDEPQRDSGELSIRGLSLPNRVRFASVVVTYRCNGKCQMCNMWKFPTREDEEIGPEVYEKLPFVATVNITGGEPFLREDLEEIVRVVKARSRRVVISTNGYFTDRIVRLFEKHPDIGLRVSIEGLPKVNDELRGIPDGFDRGLRTLLELAKRGVRDIGFGITVSDANIHDLVPLYQLSRMMGLEFATAAVHNSFYFRKFDNRIERQEEAAEEFATLISLLLRSRKVKDWFRAYFNLGLVNYIQGKPRLLSCRMGQEAFFLDPHGRILPCNVMEEPLGNLKEGSFEELWTSPRAREVRQMCRQCTRNCWMMGSVAEEIKKHAFRVMLWVLRNKLRPAGKTAAATLGVG